jgi:multiple sugar transport system permease protein
MTTTEILNLLARESTMTIKAVGPKNRSKIPRTILTVFLSIMAVAWMIPLIGALLTSFRSYTGDTRPNGIFSVPKTFGLENYREAWKVGGIGRHLWNTAFIIVPSIIFILLFASLVGFACTQFDRRFNVFFLVLFTAGNLMPAQILFQPLYKALQYTPWPDLLSDTNNGHLSNTKIAVIILHIALQTGFCVFVLSNFMKTLPKELTEAALVDGASVNTQFWKIILPLCRPALAALGTLEFTWLYNDFFWGSLIIQSGIEKPITSSIAQLSGEHGADYGLIAGASVMIAIPTILIYALLQKHFIGGLTLGANKG